MSINFKYVPVSGALSGQSFEKQTEQAINELGIVLDASNATSVDALDAANNALRTANNALSTAENAYTDAHNAAVAADQAQITADAAQNIAESAASQSAQAYDLAAQAESMSGDAINTAQSAQAAAETASAAAAEAAQTASVAQQTSESALALAEMANGVFTVDETQRDANEAYDDAEKSYLTNMDPESPNLNFPSSLKTPLWFEVSLTDNGHAVIQTCRDENASLVFTRKGTVDKSDPENTTVTWTPWKSENVLKYQAPEEVVVDLDSMIENGRFLVLTGDLGAGNNQPLNSPAPGDAYLTVLDDSKMGYIRQDYELCDSDASFYRWGTFHIDEDTGSPVVTYGAWNRVTRPEAIKSITVQENPAGQPEGVYLVLVSDTSSGEVTSYIDLSQIIGAEYEPGNGGIAISADNKISLRLDMARFNGLGISPSGIGLSLATSSTGSKAGEPGAVVYAANFDTSSPNKAVTPSGLSNRSSVEATSNTLMVRDDLGRAQVEEPHGPRDIVNKDYLELVTVNRLEPVSTTNSEQMSVFTDNYTNLEVSSPNGIIVDITNSEAPAIYGNPDDFLGICKTIVFDIVNNSAVEKDILFYGFTPLWTSDPIEKVSANSSVQFTLIFINGKARASALWKAS